jgi:hypothetical protein
VDPNRGIIRIAAAAGGLDAGHHVRGQRHPWLQRLEPQRWVGSALHKSLAEQSEKMKGNT